MGEKNREENMTPTEEQIRQRETSESSPINLGAENGSVGDAGIAISPEPVDYTFRFEAAGDGPPLSVRVRKMLKSALRAYRLRASWVGSTRSTVSASDAAKVPLRSSKRHSTIVDETP
jgi:hypothetical protein